MSSRSFVSRWPLWALALALAAAAPLAAQSPHDLVTRAVGALGGEQAVRSVTGVTWDYHSTIFGLGQSELPESPARATVSYGRGVHDYRGWRRALSQENRLLTGVVQRQRLAVTATTGMNEINGQPAPVGLGQLRFMRLSPERLLLTALDNPGWLGAQPTRTLRGAPHDGVRLAGGPDTVTIWFDRVTGLPVVVETLTDDPVLGDRATQWWLTRYQPAGPILWPRQWDIVVNGQLQQHFYVTTATANAAIPESLFAMPDSIARRTLPPTPPPPAPLVVTLNELAPGVWRAEGSTHHTLVVEQGNQLVLIEAPQSTQRVRAVLDTLRSRFPNKRVGLVVATHYHWDHAGGLREIVAENIPIVTLEANAAFIRQMAAAPRTVAPDLQAQRRRRPNLRTFTDSLIIGDGGGMVVLYRTPTVHAEGLLSAWVPSARVLFTSDVLQPGREPVAGGQRRAGGAGPVTRPGAGAVRRRARRGSGVARRGARGRQVAPGSA